MIGLVLLGGDLRGSAVFDVPVIAAVGHAGSYREVESAFFEVPVTVGVLCNACKVEIDLAVLAGVTEALG